MSSNSIREHFIPLRKCELVDALCADQAMPAEARERFCRFSERVTAVFHFEFDALLEQLKSAYAPFDPDADTKPLNHLTAEQKQRSLNDLFQEFGTLLERAGYKHLSREDIEPTLHARSYWGLNMDVDFRVFERLAIFARGDTVEKRIRRVGWRRRRDEVTVPVYQRLVMILKLRPHRRLGSKVDTEKVYLQLFKDIPKLDMKMLLPGARVRISQFDRSKIGVSLISGLGLTAWRILQDIAHNVGEFFLSMQHPAAMWGLATGTLGYGVKSYYNYQQTRQRYNLSLREILYFQNLDTNAGVLFRLLDEAEEQACRETILAYYFLNRYGGDKGWTPRDLDLSVEWDLEQRTSLQVDFAIQNALAKLEHLNLVDKVEDRYRARPLDQALQALDEIWDNYSRSDLPRGKEKFVLVSRAFAGSGPGSKTNG